MIWLSYMLKLKKDRKIKKLNEFYEAHIKNNSHYTNCKKIIIIMMIVVID